MEVKVSVVMGPLRSLLRHTLKRAVPRGGGTLRTTGLVSSPGSGPSRAAVHAQGEGDRPVLGVPPALLAEQTPSPTPALKGPAENQARLARGIIP